MIGMVAVFAELELSMMKERQRIGIRRARLEGKYKGRPVAIAQSSKTLMAQHVQAGNSYRKTADHFNVSVGTVQRAVIKYK
jgi:DNA invertase Pin-like site-specific DNA recombinase